MVSTSAKTPQNQLKVRGIRLLSSGTNSRLFWPQCSARSVGSFEKSTDTPSVAQVTAEASMGCPERLTVPLAPNMPVPDTETIAGL